MNSNVALNPEYDTILTNSKKIHEHIKAQFTNFLQSFQQRGVKKYYERIKNLYQVGKHILVINRQDFYKYDSDLADTVLNQYSRYEYTLNEALTQLIELDEKKYDYEEDKKNFESKEKTQMQRQRYEVSFDKGVINESMEASVRDLKCQMLGRLRSIVGTVTRVSQIRPELLIGVFNCGFCGRLSQNIPQQYKYQTPKRCLAVNCDNKSVWNLSERHSVFADFQKLRVQQDASKIPPGSMPRSIDVILRNQNIEKGQPGDQVHIVGYLAVIPDIQSMLKPGQRTAVFNRNPNTRRQIDQQGINGMKGIKQLSYKLCFIANNIFVMNNQFNQEILTQEEEDEFQQGISQSYSDEQMKAKIFQKLNQTEKMEIKRINQHPRMFQRLAESLFNQIFGHIQIKKALLLQLLGGVHKKTQTKISLRGDINILIVGDPSTAKSQFLKCINKFVPRSVYTNGKTTTAAGLTASVVRDEESGNVSIEAGALLLADNGICCIDEFDKMDIKDQVAIHEAMEQQTISIAKAGIQATLHARTSILAAANPIFGRYEKSQSLRKNINISPPIMSRFDLYFIICDEVNQESDKRLSDFIVQMHRHKKAIELQKPYTTRQVRNYISVAKKIKPRLTNEASVELRRSYVNLRKSDLQKQNTQYQVTVRQLQSMIRLSEALAKLHLDMQIKPEYVRQAYRLLSCSIVKLQKSAIQLVDDNDMTANEKESLGLRDLVAMNQTQTKQTKRNTVTVPHEFFEQIKNRVFELFHQKQTRHKKDKIEDVSLYLTQEDIIGFLLATDLDACNLQAQFEVAKANKMYHGIINKLIKQNFLIELQKSKKPSQRKVCLHPRAIQDDGDKKNKKKNESKQQ